MPKTIVVNGVTDDREFQTKGIDQYSTEDANINELFVSMENKTCTLDKQGLKPRFGSAGAFFGGVVSRFFVSYL